MRIDHLTMQTDGSKEKWMRPKHDDIQDVFEQQIIPCDVSGEWEITSRTAVFIVQNYVEIEKHFQELFS